MASSATAARFAAGLVAAAWLVAGCGSADDAAGARSAGAVEASSRDADAEGAAPGTSAGTGGPIGSAGTAAVPGSAEPTAQNIAATGMAIAGLVDGGARGDVEATPMSAAEALQVLAELGRPGLELSPEQRARLQSAQETLYGAAGSDRRLKNEDRVREALGQQAQAAAIKADWLARQPADWKLHRQEERGGEAELVVRVGDIDNLGFGWPVDFDPFSGASTPPHGFPWQVDPADPPGTDRIMVISGWRGKPGPKPKHDGYTRMTKRPANAVQPVTLRFDAGRMRIAEARLQIFVDDFQAPSFGNRYEVTLDDEPAPHIAEALNVLRQRGPVGKLVTLQVLPEQLHLLADGELQLLIDDPHTDAGDGFAIDFVRLLLNPGAAPASAVVSGRVVDRKTRQPISGVLVSAGSVVESVTGAEGEYRLEGVPAGLAVVSASHQAYRSESEARDVLAGSQKTIDFRLEPRDERPSSIQKALDENGHVDLYGIEFDTNEATIRAVSEETLDAVLRVLERRAELTVRIVGHTDSVGSADANRALSQRRARAVADWLIARGIAGERLEVSGSGESRPVASNATEEGRARNRRVEMAVRR